MRRGLLSAALLLAALGCGKKEGPAAGEKFAVLNTSKGAIKVRLFAAEAPRTVAHFIALAQGTKAWRDPRDGKTKRAPLYDGLLFHRVIPGFMIQTGDPLGSGEGEIGTTIADEIDPKRRFDRPGLVGMASFGPNTSGSQFFITLSPNPDLNGRHTIIGEVVEGMIVVKAISAVPRDLAHEANRPLEPIVLKSVVVTEKP